MNRIYRLVFNCQLGLVQIASELVGSHAAGGRATCRRLTVSLAILPLAWALASPARAQTLPTGGTITSGSAAISSADGAMTIAQSSTKAILDWQTFSIGSTAQVAITGGSDIVTLNRVAAAGGVSQIDGALNSTGLVFLLNPNGVVFGSGAQVNVGGLVASTLSMTNGDFISGSYKLAGSNTGVTVTVSDGASLKATGSSGIGLLANQVDVAAGSTLNAGTGNIVLGAINAGTLGFDGNGGMTLSVDTSSAAALASSGTGVTTSGSLTAGNVDLVAALDGAASNAINVGGTVAATGITVDATGGAVSLSGDLAASTLDISSSGAVEQSVGSLAITGDTTVAADGGITLEGGSNDFTGAVSASGAGVSLYDANDLSIGSIASSGNNAVSLVAGGTLTLSSAGINTGTGALTLSSLGGTLSSTGTLQGGNVALTGRDGISLLGDVNASGTLSMRTTNAAISQVAGTMLVAGTTSLDAGTGAITLAGIGNDFGSAVSATGGAVTLTDANTLTLGTVTAGSLTATAGNTLSLGTTTVGGALAGTSSNGSIIQSGAVSVAGTSTLTAAGGITLNNSGNDFGGAVTASGGAVSLADANDLVLGTVAASTLTATAGGALTQSGALTVNGASNLSAGGGIALNNSGNDFSGTVTASGAGISLYDTGDLSIASITSWGNNAVSLVAGETLTLPLAGINTGTGALTLSSLGGALSSTGTLQGGNVALAGRDGITLLGDVNASDTLSMTTANAAISQTAGTVTAAGITTLGAGTGAITLAGVGNDFGSVVSATGGRVTLFDANDLVLGAVTAGTLAVNAGGGLTQSAALRVDGTSTLTAGEWVALDGGNNDFGGAVTASGAGVLLSDINDLTIGGITSSWSGAVILSAGGTLTLPAGGIDAGTGALMLSSLGGTLSSTGTLQGGNVTLAGRDGISLSGDVNASGTLSMTTTNAGIAQTVGTVTAAGTTTLGAGTGAITLAGVGNDFGSAVSATGGAVTLTDANDLALGTVAASTLTANAGGALALGATTVTGDATLEAGTALDLGSSRIDGALLATSGGNITQSSALQVGGNTMLSATGDVTLDSSSNDFTGTVNASGNAVTLTDANTLTLGTVAASTLTANAGDALALGTTTVTGDATLGAGTALDLGSSRIDGALLATSGGNITQSSALQVGGTSTLNATGDITLDNSSNDFAGTVNASGGAVTLTDANDLTLGTVTAGTLTANAGDALALGTTTVTGDAVLEAGTVLTSGSRRTSRVLLATSGGNITQSGALEVGGTTTLSATGDIILDNSGNDFTGTVNASGNAVTLADANTLTLGTVAASTLTASAGDVLALGATAVTGDAVLDAGSNVTLTDAVQVGGVLRVVAGNDIQQGAGGLTAGTFAAQAGGSLSLLGSGNHIDALGDVQAASVTLNNAQSLTIAGNVASSGDIALDVDGDLHLNGTLAGNNVWLQSSGNVDEGVGASLTALTLSGSVAGMVTLGSANQFNDNRISVLGNFSSPGGFSLTNGQTVTLASVDGSAYTVDAGHADLYLEARGGDILQTGTTWLYDGNGTFSATGSIGQKTAPIYVIGDTTQYVAAIGSPPAYFYALDRNGNQLAIGGVASVDLPTSVYTGRVQGASQPRGPYVDLAAVDADYRGYGIVEPGLRLPMDQQVQCGTGDPGAGCHQ